MGPLTINQPIPFGRQPDGQLAAAAMRQACVAVVGQPGSGKTIVEQNLVAGLVRCPDCLVWGVDLSQGGLANPWLNPWLDGGMDLPVIDWVALDAAEAHAMLDAACAIIGARRAGYRQWMARKRTDKLPVDHEVPAIYIVIDEGKKVTGSRADQKLLAKIIQVADEGRAMAVRLVISGLRGTAEVIPSEMMADIGTRIGMSVSSAAESNYLFGWNHRPNPRDTPHPGCGLWRTDLSGAPVPFRSFNLEDPDRIARIAWAAERWRPQLDAGSLAALGPELGAWYGSRWERALPILGGSDGPAQIGGSTPGSRAGSLGGSGPGSPAQLPAGPSAQAGRFTPALPAGSAPAQPPGSRDRFTELNQAARAAIDRAKRAVADDRLTGPRVDDEFARLADALADDRAAGGEGWGGDGVAVEPRARLGQLLADVGEDGTSGPKLREQLAAEGHDVPLPTLYRWLKADADDGGYGKWHPKIDGEMR